jgi:tetratricopeptide (TPR) repeat protein
MMIFRQRLAPSKTAFVERFSAMENLLGELISDRYWMLDIIGRGATGTVVFRAEDVTTGSKVTVKTFAAELVRSTEAFDNYRWAATRAGEIGSPNVPRFVDGKKAASGMFFGVSEHHDGETLAQILDRNLKLPWDRVASIVQPLVRLLQKIHDDGLLHRNIKPENILIARDEKGVETVMLLDFGTSVLWAAPGGQIDQMGGGGLLPPHAMSPQQLKKGASLDARTDLYSLGVVMYRATVGRFPYEGSSFEETKTRILAGNAQEPHLIDGDIPEEASRFIMRAMHRLPEGRFQTARELAYEMGKIAGGADAPPPAEAGEGQETSGVVALTDVVDLVGSATREAADEAARTSGEWDSIIEELTETLYSSADMDERVRAGKHLARAYETIFSDDEKAREVYGLLLLIDDRDRDVLDGLDRLSTKSGDWHGLLEILEKKIEHEEKLSAKAELLARCGDVYADKLDDTERAIKVYRRIVDELQQPTTKVLRSLEKIYKRREMWEPYVDTLNKLIPLSQPADRIDLYEEIASTWALVLKNPVRAREAAGRLLKIQPGNELARNILTELERSEREALEEETTGRIDFRKTNPATVIQDYLNRFEKEKDGGKRAKLLLKAAKVYEEQMQDTTSAGELLKKAYLEDPVNPAVVEAIERATESSGKWAELVALVQGRIAEMGDRMDTVPHYLHAARWMIERLGQMQAARTLYTKVIQIDPDNAVAHATLADMIKATGKWENYLSYLRMQASRAKRKETKAELLAKLGRTYKDELGRADLALETLRKAIAQDPLNESALDALEEIYVVNELYADLADVLQKKVTMLEARGDRERLKEQLVYLAKLHEEILEDPLSAVRCHRKVAEIDPGDMTALETLERLYTSLGHTRDLFEVMEKQLVAATGEEQRMELLRRLAARYRKDFLQPELAAEKYEQVLAADPGNVEVLEALEEIYRTLKNWKRLVEILEKHADVAPEPDKKMALLYGASQVLMKELKERDRAVEDLRRLQLIDDSHPEALRTLAGIFEEEGKYDEALAALDRLADLLKDPAERAAALNRSGQILYAKMGRPEEALGRLKEAVGLVPGHLEALGALRTIYFDTAKWDLASATLDEEIRATTERQQKSALLYVQGRIFAESLSRGADAIACYEKAMEAWPENWEAARPLAEHYIENGAWDRAEPLLDLIVKKSPAEADEGAAAWNLKLGAAAAAVGNHEKALEAYGAAARMDEKNVEAVKGMAHAFYGLERWPEAFKHYHQIVFKHADQTTPRERTDIYYYLGVCKLKMNDPRKGIQLLETILESDPKHLPTLQALMAHYESQGSYEKVVRFKQLVCDTLEGEERSACLEEIGDMWHEKLSEGTKAAAAYKEALAYRADDRKLLHKLMTLFSGEKQWKKAIEVLEEITDLEADPVRKSRYYHNIAVIYQEEVKDLDMTLEYLNKALDADPDNLKEFEAIERILTPLKDWERLEANYLGMLARISGGGKTLLEVSLLHNLGEIYRTRMQDLEAAAQQFKMASDLDPGNMSRHEILAELYHLIPQRWDDAVREVRLLIESDPDRPEFYRALRILYYEKGQIDKAWCVCGVLHVMAQANDEERAFYQQGRSGPFQMPVASIDPAAWTEHLRHPMENVLVDGIFDIILPVVVKAKTQPLKAFDLKRRDRKDPDSAKDPVAWMFGRVGAVLGIPLPELYVGERYKTGLEYILSDPAASVIGQNILTGRFTEPELTFLIAKHLTYYGGGRAMRVLEPSVAGLESILLGAVKLIRPDTPVDPEAAGMVESAVQALRAGLLPDQAARLAAAVNAFVASGAPLDLEPWLLAIECTASRAGLLLCNDLESSVNMLNTQSTGISDAPLRAKVTDLKLYSLSESHFELRRRMGMALKG